MVAIAYLQGPRMHADVCFCEAEDMNADRRIEGAIALPPGAAVVADVLFEIVTKIAQGTLQGLDGPGRQSTERIAKGEEFGVHRQQLKVLWAPLACLNGPQDAGCPPQAVATGRTPAARLLGKEVFQNLYQAHRTGV